MYFEAEIEGAEKSQLFPWSTNKSYLPHFFFFLFPAAKFKNVKTLLDGPANPISSWCKTETAGTYSVISNIN